MILVRREAFFDGDSDLHAFLAFVLKYMYRRNSAVVYGRAFFLWLLSLHFINDTMTLNRYAHRLSLLC